MGGRLRTKLGLRGRMNYLKLALAVLDVFGVFWARYRPAMTEQALKKGLERPRRSLKSLKDPSSLIKSKPSLNHD